METTRTTPEALEAILEATETTTELAELNNEAVDHQGAEMEGHLNEAYEAGHVRWEERAILRGVPVTVVYITIPEEMEMVNEGGAWDNVDWDARIVNIEVDWDTIGR